MKDDESLTSLNAELSRCRKLAEDFESDAKRYRKYLDIALCIMVIIDKDGNIEFINKQGAIILGYLEFDELIGENWFEKCCPPKIRDSLRFIHRKLIEGEVEPFSEMENSILTRFGTEKTIRWKNSFIKDEKGDVVSTVSIGSDVSREREQEKEMERLETQFEAVVQVIPESLHVINRNYKIVFANKALIDTNSKLGLSTDVQGKGLWDVFSFLPERVRDEYETVFHQGKVLITTEDTEVNGRRIKTRTRKIPLLKDDKVHQIVTIMEAISVFKT